ncbi:hypothetical protein Ae168Ps1_3506 [Pseudonocardia sp. Ae168_Ps1]|nr:hypothetical protein Ae168Ps1_3506 [Pseudonocardia sp. Ae168_Ps1]
MHLTSVSGSSVAVIDAGDTVPTDEDGAPRGFGEDRT